MVLTGIGRLLTFLLPALAFLAPKIAPSFACKWTWLHRIYGTNPLRDWTGINGSGPSFSVRAFLSRLSGPLCQEPANRPERRG